MKIFYIPWRTLAPEIASYLLLSQDAALLRQKVADEVEDSRVRPSSHKTGESYCIEVTKGVGAHA